MPGSWTLVLLPDTQNYASDFPGLFTLQTHWIAKNKDKYNIRYVLGLGDITNNNTDREWRHAREAFDELDGKVPYALVPGNHDYTPHGNAVSGTSGLNKYFPASSFRNWPTFGGVMKDGDITNSYHLFSAGGTDWIILALEWAPRNETVQWANDVLAKHPRRKAILVTHAYLYDDSTRYDYAKKGKSQTWNPHEYYNKPNDGVNDGEELWQKLVRKNNFALTFNGHVCHTQTARAFSPARTTAARRRTRCWSTTRRAHSAARPTCASWSSCPTAKRFTSSRTRRCTTSIIEDAANQFSFTLDP